CVDNVESCIQSHSEQDNELEHLKEVRDELLFALESSGVEQFEPEISSDYRGQEKLVEAVKEKEICDDPAMTGKVAEVVKPGYQYFIDEENMKVVRPAMVKLFG
ncbi:MAG: nucleotide exchange factor GrpE, partial [Sedimentisphaerales bacterium]|nr:nucleotide exchange factor GrpE [Sedimentisphaerales bacterium]